MVIRGANLSRLASGRKEILMVLGDTYVLPGLRTYRLAYRLRSRGWKDCTCVCLNPPQLDYVHLLSGLARYNLTA